MHELREVMLTAYALGELSDDDKRAVSAELAGDPEAQAFVDDVGVTAALLEHGLQVIDVPTGDDVALGGWTIAASSGAWGTSPNNLAHRSVAESARALEIKTLWRSSVLDTLSATDRPVITLGDEARTRGWGPWVKLAKPDVEAPARDLPSRTYPLAHARGEATYEINLHSSFTGHVERADGMVVPIEKLQDVAPHDSMADVQTWLLRAEETLYLNVGELTLQIRYVRRAPFVQPALLDRLNYSWVSVLVVAFFVHVVAIAAFLATPKLDTGLYDGFRPHADQLRKAVFKSAPPAAPGASPQDSLLDGLKAGTNQRAPQPQGRAGRRDALRREDADRALASLFAPDGDGEDQPRAGASEGLQRALNGLQPQKATDDFGLGGFGTRGEGPGGGGLDTARFELPRLSTRGRGNGEADYGDGLGDIGNERRARDEIPITLGRLHVEGSVDKALIRNVISEHRPQLRYCYEVQLVKARGLAGKVSVEWTITADGRVKSPRVKNSTLRSPAVERCLVQKIAGWRFPNLSGGGVIVVRYPFVFSSR